MATRKRFMTKIVKVAMIFILALGSYTFASRDVYAQITHISINQQLFNLGESPKFRVNIVSDSENYRKTQFIVRQGASEEILMIKPINKFLLLLRGVEDVKNPSAVLVIQEYRVSQWHDVKRISLFSGEVLSVVTTKVLENEIKAVKSRLRQLQGAKLDETLTEPHCSLDSLPGQTLWRIALQYSKEWKMTPQGSVVAIYEANPKAFNTQNISSLRGDSQLLCPSSQIKDRYRDSQVAQRMYKELLD